MRDESAIRALLERARSILDRVEPTSLARAMADGAVVIDTRPVEQRRESLISSSGASARQVAPRETHPVARVSSPLKNKPSASQNAHIAARGAAPFSIQE